MEIVSHQWTISTCFKVADKLKQAVFLVNKRRQIKKCNDIAIKALQLSDDQQFFATAEKALAKYDEASWGAFWLSDNNCLRMEEIFPDFEQLSIILTKINEEQAVGFLLLDAWTARKMQNGYAYLMKADNKKYNFEEIISKDESYLEVLKKVLQVADTEASVLIHGETGTGKELLARAVHNFSRRKDHPLIKINCAAMSTEAMESELFGHEKDAFTGAFSQKIGLFELANEGTLLLDQIGDLPLKIQAKLLRVLQEGTFKRLGGIEYLQVDVRIISTSSKDLDIMMQTDDFRKDLYYRLNGFPIYNIPLRERKSDIPLLINHFRKKYAKKMAKKITRVSDKELRQIMTYDFPGNVRELENLIERAVILSNSSKLNLEAVLPDLSKVVNRSGTVSTFLTFEEMQREYIVKALEKTQWRVSGTHSAASLLGLNAKTLTSKMRKLDIRRKDFVNK
ncbi:MAG: sigma-54 dependent transcriptional regulator [Bacteroidota bacterium]